MNEQPLTKDIFAILRILSSNDNLTQRDLSKHLSISLGKTNYLLKALIKIGLLEIRNFTTGNRKVQKAKYFLTKKGLEEKVRLTYHFLKERELEYNLIKKEWEKLRPLVSATSTQENHLEASNLSAGEGLKKT